MQPAPLTRQVVGHEELRQRVRVGSGMLEELACTRKHTKLQQLEDPEARAAPDLGVGKPADPELASEAKPAELVQLLKFGRTLRICKLPQPDRLR